MQTLSKRIQAFSLLELLVVITLLALLATAGSMDLRALWLRYQAETFITELNQLLRFSRSYAISQQQQVRVCPALDQLCVADWQLAPITSSVMTAPSTAAAPLQQLALLNRQFSLSYSRAEFIFRPDGSLDLLGSGSFILCSRQAMPWHFRLTLSQAGRSRVNFYTAPCPA